MNKAWYLVDEAHLPLHHVFIAADIPGPPLHLVVVTDPDLIGYLVNEAEIVAHKHHASVKAPDGISQGINGLQVQVVGRLQKGDRPQGSNVSTCLASKT